MKKLIYKKGNLLTDQSIDVAAHVCNTQHIFGSGIALSIKKMYPEAYEADDKAAQDKSNKLGEISYVGIRRNDKPFVIFNLYGQHLYGVGVRHLNYEAIYTALEKMRKVCDMAETSFAARGLPMPTVGFPKLMGCDRAGGNFLIVERMIEVVFDGYSGDVIIVEWDGS